MSHMGKTIRPKWFIKLSKGIVRAVIVCEILVVLAAHIPSAASTYVLATLDHGDAGRAAHRVRITPTFAAGWVLMVVGGLIRIACYRAMGKHFTFEITIRKDHRLVTNGPYSVVRHPGYTAHCLVIAGLLVACFGDGAWLTECGMLHTLPGKVFGMVWAADLLYVPVVMVFVRVRKEDGLLRKEFGSEWEAWVERTPYALIPWLY
ncbi:hypothetical protein BD413DRAFT_205569 [Trametes elegans]|nr:hypothetical protein BD413DRAFT_205569 [Trametes elegans]